jgi:hypothetical protein
MPQESDGFRKRDRLELHVPVRIRCRESDGTEWHELSKLEDVTQFGTSFVLDHRLDVGRIIHLTTPLPWRLRLFDQASDLYRVYALVRWTRPVDGKMLVGVAFVGKTPPASYLHDPSRIYGTDGFTEKRRESRIDAAIQVCVETIDERGDVIASEATVTTNISRHGATCFTSLSTLPGNFVRITSEDGDVTTTAIVRARRTDSHGIPMLHLEFVGSEWPLDLAAADD